MGLRTLDAAQAEALERLCEVIVPGSARVGPATYVDAQLAAMPDGVRAGAIAAIERLGEAARGGATAIAEHAPSADFLMLRALAVEAFYSDFVAPGRATTGAWDEIDFHPPATAALHKDWSYLGIDG
ncbi:MAG TPA: hypothetical protein VID68_14310 [Solirubrobacteraceae bacterium]|jgi:hypothetical protein